MKRKDKRGDAQRAPRSAERREELGRAQELALTTPEFGAAEACWRTPMHGYQANLELERREIRVSGISRPRFILAGENWRGRGDSRFGIG